MNKKTINYALLTLIVTATCLVSTSQSFGGGKILPSFDSIFRQREVQSKERLLKKLTDNYQNVPARGKKQRPTNGGSWQQADQTPMPMVTGDSLSAISNQHYEPTPIVRKPKPYIPVSNSIPVFIPYKDIDKTDTEGFCFVSEKLIAKLKGQQKEDKPKAATLPAKLGFSKASFKVFIEPGNVARVDGKLDVEVYEKGYLVFPFEVNSHTGCTSLTVDGKPAKTLFDKGNLRKTGYQLNPRVILAGPGKHKIAFSNFSSVTSKGNDQWSLTFHIPESISAELITDLPGRNLHVEIEKSSVLEPLVKVESTSKNRTINRCFLEPTARIAMKWYRETNKRSLDATLPVLSTMGTPQKIKKKPVVMCSVFNRTTFNDGLLSVNATFRYNVTQAEIDVLTLHVPSTLELLSIKGPSGKELKTWNIEGETVTVFLPSQRKGLIQLKVYGQSFLLNKMKDLGSSKELSLSLPFMTALNTVSSTCFIGLKLGKSLSPDFAESQQFTNITPQDLPSWLPKGQQRGLTCFKAMTSTPEEGPSMTIVQESLSFPDSFRITRAEVATILTKESISQTKAVFTIINSRKQFLPVRLPEGSTFQSLYVDSSPAKAGLIDSTNKEQILIPLTKSPLNNRNKPQPFTVELVFSTPIKALGSFGTVQLEAMSTDETIEKLQWKVSYPPQLLFTRNDGSLEEIEDANYGLAQVSTRANQAYNRRRHDLAANAMPMSQSAQFMDPQSNIQGLSKSGFEYNSNLQSMDNQKQKTEGTLPVRVYLPETGKQLSFEADNVDTRTELPWLTISYSKIEYVNKFENLLFIFSLLTSVMFLLNLWKKKGMKTPSIMLILTLVTTGILYSLFGRSIGTLLKGLVAGVSIIMVYGIFSPLRKWMKKTTTVAVALIAFLGILTTSLLAEVPGATENEIKVFVPYESKKLTPQIKRYSNGGFVPRKLIVKAREIQKANSDKEEKSQIPTRTTLQKVFVDGTVRNHVINLNLRCKVTTYDDEWIEIPVIRAFGSITEAQVDGMNVPVTVETDNNYLRNEVKQNKNILRSLDKEDKKIDRNDNPLSFFVPISKKGEHLITLSIVIDEIEHFNSWRGMVFSLPDYPIRNISLSLSGTDMKISMPDSRKITVKENRETEVTKVSAVLGGSREIKIKWLKKAVFTTDKIIDEPEKTLRRKQSVDVSPDTPGTAKAASEGEQLLSGDKLVPHLTTGTSSKALPTDKVPLIIANVCTKVTIDETQLNGTVFVDYKISREGIEVIKLKVPIDIRISRIHGILHRDYRVIADKKGEFQTLAILLKRKSQGTLITGFDFTRTLPDFSGETTVTIPTVVSLDTNLVSGAIGIERSGNIEMIEMEGTEGVEKSSYPKLPSAFKPYLSPNGWLVYRFRQSEWKLNILARKHPAAVGYTATIEGGTFNTSLNRRGQGDTSASILVRNFGQSFLNVEIAPGVGEFKSLTIDGVEENYMLLSRKKIIRIPLRKPIEGKDYAEHPMTINFRFIHSMVSPYDFKKLSHKNITGEKTALFLPRMNLPVTGDGLIWNVTMSSSKQHLTGFKGEKFRPCKKYNTKSPELFNTETGSSLRLFLPWLSGWPDGFDESTSKSLLVYMNIRSSNMTYIIFFIACLLAFAFGTLTLILIADLRRPWLFKNIQFYWLGLLVLVLLLETVTPGNGSATAIGGFCSPLLFLLIHSKTRWSNGHLVLPMKEGDE